MDKGSDFLSVPFIPMDTHHRCSPAKANAASVGYVPVAPMHNQGKGEASSTPSEDLTHTRGESTIYCCSAPRSKEISNVSFLGSLFDRNLLQL